MYILHEAEGPKQERDWRLDYRTVSGGSTHYTGNKKKIKMEKILQTAGYLGPDFKQAIEASTTGELGLI